MGSTDATASMIQLVRQAMLVSSAVGPQLDAVGNNHNVPRPENTSDDELYRRLVKALAWLPKSILLSYYALLSAVYGSQEQVRLQVGRAWKVYEVNANEVVVELPAALVPGTPEVSTYLHGASGYARVSSGPSNVFTTDFDLRASSATTVVGMAVHVETAPGAWTDYTISSYAFSAGVATVTVSASTLPAGGGRFYLEVPGDSVSSYRGDYFAPGGLQSLYSTAAGPTTNTLSVVGDVTGSVLPGATVTVGVNDALQTRVVASLSYSSSTSFPATAAAMAAACGGGTWAAGWLCEDAASPLTGAFGGVNLPEDAAGGSPSYRLPGPLGDAAVRVSVSGTGFLAASSSFLDADNTKDVCGVIVMRTRLPLSTSTTILSKDDFVGGPGFDLTISPTQVLWSVDNSTPGSISASASVPDTALTNNEWVAVMWALERGTNTMRVAIQSLASGALSVGASLSSATVGSLSNASPFRLARAGSLGNTLEVAALYMGVGVGVAAGIPANLGPRLASFCASLGAANVTRVVLTTTDVPGGQARQAFISAQEAADTATTPSHSDRVYLTGTGIYQIVQFYLDLLVRASGVVVRLQIV